MSVERSNERWHALRRALHTASLQVEVARTVGGSGPDGDGDARARALDKARTALERAAEIAADLEEEPLR